MSRHQVITALVIIAVAATAMSDTARKSGWTSTGPDAGWYPFWSAAMMGGAAVLAMLSAWRDQSGSRFFGGSEGARAFWQVAIPMVVGALLLNWLGFYIVGALYMGYFARWVGGYRWYWGTVLAVGIPLALYLVFEVVFKLPLPKSPLYFQGIAPF